MHNFASEYGSVDEVVWHDDDLGSQTAWMALQDVADSYE